MIQSRSGKSTRLMTNHRLRQLALQISMAINRWTFLAAILGMHRLIGRDTKCATCRPEPTRITTKTSLTSRWTSTRIPLGQAGGLPVQAQRRDPGGRNPGGPDRTRLLLDVDQPARRTGQAVREIAALMACRASRLALGEVTAYKAGSLHLARSGAVCRQSRQVGSLMQCPLQQRRLLIQSGPGLGPGRLR